MWRNFYINLLILSPHNQNKSEVVKMFRKKSSEEIDYEYFFSRFEFADYPDGMEDFGDK